MAIVHLGCGNQYLDDYINVDSDDTERVDVIADARSLPFIDNSIETIEAYHLLEHIPRQQIKGTLEEWFRVINPHGKLVVELPDFEQNCKDLIKAIKDKDWEIANWNMMVIYGGDTPAPQDAHRWGYNADSVEALLKRVGFVEVEQTEPMSFHKDQAASFRLEAVKNG